MDGLASSQQQSAPSGSQPAPTSPTSGGSTQTTLGAPTQGAGNEQLTQPKPGSSEIGANGGPDTSDWRALLAGEDAKAVEQLSRYQSPNDFLKAHNELRKTLSQRAEVPKLSDTSTPDEIAAYRKAFDVPEVSQDAKDEAYAEAYGLKMPEGVDVPPALLGAFAKQMNAAHISKGVAQKVVGEFAKIQLAVQERAEKINVEKRKEWTNALRDQLGAKEYDGHIAAANGWLQDQFKDNEDGLHRLLTYQAPDGGLLGDDPFFIKLFAEKGMGAGYTDMLQANAFEAGGKSLGDQQREIDALRWSNRQAYDEAMAPGGRYERIIQLRLSRGEIDELGNERQRRRA